MVLIGLCTVFDLSVCTEKEVSFCVTGSDAGLSVLNSEEAVGAIGLLGLWPSVRGLYDSLSDVKSVLNTEDPVVPIKI